MDAFYDYKDDPEAFEKATNWVKKNDEAVLIPGEVNNDPQRFIYADKDWRYLWASYCR